MAATRVPGWLRLWLGRDKPGEGREAFRVALARPEVAMFATVTHTAPQRRRSAPRTGAAHETEQIVR